MSDSLGPHPALLQAASSWFAPAAVLGYLDGAGGGGGGTLAEHGANVIGQALPASTEMQMLVPPVCLHSPAVPTKHPAHRVAGGTVVVVAAAATAGGGGGGNLAEHGANVIGQALPASTETQMLLPPVCLQPPAVPTKHPAHMVAGGTVVVVAAASAEVAVVAVAVVAVVVEQVHGHWVEINSMPHDATNPAHSASSVQSSANIT